MLQMLHETKKINKVVGTKAESEQAPKISRGTRARRRFIKAWEEQFGNVTYACAQAGISRQTYYRWIKSHKPRDRKFREILERIRPMDRLKDSAEFALFKLIEQNDLKATIFALKKYGGDRGWGEPTTARSRASIQEEVRVITDRINQRSRSQGKSFLQELDVYLEIFRDYDKPEIVEALEKLRP